MGAPQTYELLCDASGRCLGLVIKAFLQIKNVTANMQS